MYDVAAMKQELESALAIAEMKVRDRFVDAFRQIYADHRVPEMFPGSARIDRINLASPADLNSVYSGPGLYVVLTDRPVAGNFCRLTSGSLVAIYRGECATVRKRIQSHLFNGRYRDEYATRSTRWQSATKNSGKSFYEAHWPHCLKLDPGGASGIDIDQAPHSAFRWVILVHRMKQSSQAVRKLAELAFDDAFGHPAASRDA